MSVWDVPSILVRFMMNLSTNSNSKGLSKRQETHFLWLHAPWVSLVIKVHSPEQARLWMTGKSTGISFAQQGFALSQEWFLECHSLLWDQCFICIFVAVWISWQVNLIFSHGSETEKMFVRWMRGDKAKLHDSNACAWQVFAKVATTRWQVFRDHCCTEPFQPRCFWIFWELYGTVAPLWIPSTW